MDDIERFIALPAERNDRRVRALGIDLGATNSTVSEVSWEPGKSASCNVRELKQPTQAGEYTSPLVPSILVELPNKEVWIGEGAKVYARPCTKQGNPSEPGH